MIWVDVTPKHPDGTVSEFTKLRWPCRHGEHLRLERWDLGGRYLANDPQPRKWKWLASIGTMSVGVFLDCEDTVETAKARAIPALLAEFSRLAHLLENEAKDAALR